ncbi:MAG: J domain-containing protein [Cyclobacteriaceae bacterium]
MKDYYKILGVDRTASTDVVKKHFRIKALLTHPDKTNRETRTDFIEIYEAYTVLSNSKTRERYDSEYDRFSSSLEGRGEFKIDPKRIDLDGNKYADDFRLFRRKILWKILIELFFSADDLLFASCVTTFFGLWTIGKGIFAQDFAYSIVGLVVTLTGLFFGRLKINRIAKEVNE